MSLGMGAARLGGVGGEEVLEQGLDRARVGVVPLHRQRERRLLLAVDVKAHGASG